MDTLFDPVRLYGEAMETGALPKLHGDDALPELNAALDAIRAACAPGDDACRRRVNRAYDAAMAFGAESADDGIRFGAGLFGVACPPPAGALSGVEVAALDALRGRFDPTRDGMAA